MSGPAIRFEVDISPTIGSGHLSRCKVLAAALAAQGARCTFALHGMDEGGQSAPFDPAGDEAFDAVVVDRYTASVAEIAALRARCTAMLVFDDHAARPVSADLVLNGNYYAPSLDYAAYTFRRALLGPEFALVTPAFVQAGKATPEPGHVLMTFGLSRISAVLPALADALADALPDMQFSVIVPAAFRGAGARHPRVTLREPAPLAKLVGAAEWVISGLGVTWQEIVASGRNSVGVRLVDNQDLMLDALVRDGFPVASEPSAQAVLGAVAVARSLPEAHWAPLRQQLDGGGPKRVAEALLAQLAK